MRLLLTLCTILCLDSQAVVKRFEIRDAIHRDVVHFLSDAPLGRTYGLNQWIHGWVEVDLDNIHQSKGEFEVDMRGFETGLGLRDHHLRESFLSTKKHPFSKFTIQKITDVSSKKLIPSQPVVAQITGALTFQGKTTELKVKAKIVYFPETIETKARMSGNLLRISSDFPLDLKAIGVPWTEEMRLLIAQFIKVGVDVVGSDGEVPKVAPPALSLEPQPPAPKER